jgi:hypothetical protein
MEKRTLRGAKPLDVSRRPSVQYPRQRKSLADGQGSLALNDRARRVSMFPNITRPEPSGKGGARFGQPPVFYRWAVSWVALAPRPSGIPSTRIATAPARPSTRRAGYCYALFTVAPRVCPFTSDKEKRRTAARPGRRHLDPASRGSRFW